MCEQALRELCFVFVAVNECESSPCVNSAQCVDGLSGYYCRCPQTYTGVHCERGESPTLLSPCQRDTETLLSKSFRFLLLFSRGGGILM